MSDEYLALQGEFTIEGSQGEKISLGNCPKAVFKESGKFEIKCENFSNELLKYLLPKSPTELPEFLTKSELLDVTGFSYPLDVEKEFNLYFKGINTVSKTTSNKPFLATSKIKISSLGDISLISSDVQSLELSGIYSNFTFYKTDLKKRKFKLNSSNRYVTIENTEENTSAIFPLSRLICIEGDSEESFVLFDGMNQGLSLDIPISEITSILTY